MVFGGNHVSRFRRPPPRAFASPRATVRSRVVRATRPYTVVQERGSGRSAGNGGGEEIEKLTRIRAFYHNLNQRRFKGGANSPRPAACTHMPRSSLDRVSHIRASVLVIMIVSSTYSRLALSRGSRCRESRPSEGPGPAAGVRISIGSV